MVVVVVLQFGRRSIGFTLRSATRERRSGAHAPERTMADYHRQRRIKLIVTCTINGNLRHGYVVGYGTPGAVPMHQ